MIHKNQLRVDPTIDAKQVIPIFNYTQGQPDLVQCIYAADMIFRTKNTVLKLHGIPIEFETFE